MDQLLRMSRLQTDRRNRYAKQPRNLMKFMQPKVALEQQSSAAPAFSTAIPFKSI